MRLRNGIKGMYGLRMGGPGGAQPPHTTRPAAVAGLFRMDSSQQLISFDSSHMQAPAPNGGFADKVSKYKWKKLGPKGNFRWINKEEIRVDRTYQRSNVKTKAKIRDIAANWNWQSCNAISVMERPDGLLVAVDGQHRLLASWKRSDITELPCMVFRSSDIADEASAFIELNTNRKPVSAFSKYRAKLVAGDEVASKITAIALANGITVREDGNQAAATSCIATMQRLLMDNESRFEKVFAVAADLAKADETSITAILLDGLTVIDNKCPGGLSSKRLLARVAQVGATLLVDSATKMSYRVGKGGSRVWAEGMIEILNRGLRLKFKLQA